MKFEYNGVSYLIEFERQFRVPTGQVLSKKQVRTDGPAGIARPVTTAKLLRVDVVDGVEFPEVIRSYTVSQSHKDRNCYEDARKAALTLALYDAPIEKSNGSGEPQIGEHLTKEFRTAVWNAYHNRFEIITPWTKSKESLGL